MDAPKYAQLELERRWLVDEAKLPSLELPCKHIEDSYLTDTRLRLRAVTVPTPFTNSAKSMASEVWRRPSSTFTCRKGSSSC